MGHALIKILSVFASFILMMQAAYAKCEGDEKVVRLIVLAGKPDSAQAFLAKEIQTEFQRSLNGKWCIAFEPLKEGVSTLDAVRAGNSDMGMVTLDSIAFAAPLHRIFELPFAFRDRLALQKFLSGEASLPLRRWKNDGVRSLALVPFGMESIGARKALLNPLDMAGVPFALTTEQATRPMIAQLRGTGRVVPPDDLLKALQDKRFEAQMARWQSFATMKTDAVHTVFTQTSHAVVGAQVIASDKWAKSLKAVDLATLERSIKKAVELFATRQLAREKQAMDAIMRSGKAVYLVTRKQRQEWRDAMKSLSQAYASLSGGKAILAGVKAAHKLP